jgi:hypothetical protein
LFKSNLKSTQSNIQLILEIKKKKLNEKEIRDSLTLFGIKPELIAQIERSIIANSKRIHVYLSKLKLDTLAFHDLEWRLDIKVASRSLRRQVEPEILLKFDLSKQQQQLETKVLQTDIVNLNHLTSCLEDALNEIKSNYCRRVFRSVV